MHPTRACTAALLALGWAGACLAQAASAPLVTLPPPPPPQAALPASAPASAAQARPQKQVIEDGKVRIEETRLRGQVQRITVQSKLPGVRGYEILLPPAGKDPSQDRGAAGQRTWSIFDF